MALLFVYGSLKEGFPNFHVNAGRRIAGVYRTVQAYPLYLAEGRLPCLLATPGSGHHVVGQLFEVTPEALAAMDALERVGERGGYARVAIEVTPADAAAEATATTANVYVQSAARLATPGPHLGPLAEYTLEHAKALDW
jgi:gamma-glutamylaminecyclotransferase